MKDVVLTIILIFVARAAGDMLDAALGTVVVGSSAGVVVHNIWLMTSGAIIGLLLAVRKVKRGLNERSEHVLPNT